MFGKKLELFEIKIRSFWKKKKEKCFIWKKVGSIWKKVRSVWKKREVFEKNWGVFKEKWEGPK